jgi:hypothetical protein
LGYLGHYADPSELDDPKVYENNRKIVVLLRGSLSVGKKRKPVQPRVFDLSVVKDD